MFRMNTFFGRFFETKNSEQLQMEKQLKEMTVKDVVRSFECKQEVQMENNTQMEQEILEETSIVEDAQNEEAVSEETEVVEEVATETDEEVIEPTAESDVETEQVAEEQPQEGQEEPQAEEVEEQPEVVEEGEGEIAEEPAEVVEEPEVEPEIEAEVEPEQAIEAPENMVKTNEIVQPVAVDNTAELLAQIEQLKSEKAQQEIEMQKMTLAKEVEQKFAGVAGKTEDKVEMVYEIQNCALSENTKSFILNSLELLSKQNLKDCQEIGHSQEVEVDENQERQQKVQKAMSEHGLTENQAILFINGDRTLAEAKKVSARVQSKKK